MRVELTEKCTTLPGNFSRSPDLVSGILEPSPTEDASALRRTESNFQHFPEIVIMQASLRRSILSASFVAIASALVTAPAGAMGRSTTPSIHKPDASSRIETAQKNIVTTLQTQVEALRQEVALLKERVDRQDVAAAE
jgi:hypothetical protein